jgi:hypothetical protein
MMPRFRRLGEAEIAALNQPSLGARAQVAREYDAYIADFVIGDYGRTELHEGERRDTVRRQLQAAAKRRGLVLRFHSGHGPLTFRVEAAPAVASPTPPLEPVRVAPVAAQRDEATIREPAPPRPPRRRPTAAERYHEVLPRWMREGQAPGRRGESKRRRAK